jgi:solute carrier family 25 carnitine/acylcarnitine transporter 20/29
MGFSCFRVRAMLVNVFPCVLVSVGDTIATSHVHDVGRSIATINYQGLSLSLLREIPANACYFMTYEILLRRAGHYDEATRTTASPWVLLGAGGLAGVANWLFVFPIDTIKSRYQTDPLAQPRYTGIGDCIRQTLAEGRVWRPGSAGAQSPHWSWPYQGIVRVLFQGYSACLARAFVANAVTWGGVEMVKRAMPMHDSEVWDE